MANNTTKLKIEDNKMYHCLQCNKKVTFARGYCSKKCHDKYYDEINEMIA